MYIYTSKEIYTYIYVKYLEPHGRLSVIVGWAEDRDCFPRPAALGIPGRRDRRWWPCRRVRPRPVRRVAAVLLQRCPAAKAAMANTADLLRKVMRKRRVDGVSIKGTRGRGNLVVAVFVACVLLQGALGGEWPFGAACTAQIAHGRGAGV